MTTSDTYRLVLPVGYRILVFGVISLLSLSGVGLIVAAIRDLPRAAPVLFALVWCAGVSWQWYVLLGIPYEIRFNSPSSISFVALGRTSTLAASDMDSLKPYGSGGGFYVLRHNGGKIRLMVQFTGFYEVLSRIKAANPTFETVGI